jgi:hypothetical protein
MSVWDIVIIVLAVAQLIALGAVFYAVLQIKKGPLARFLPRIVSIVKNGGRLSAAGVLSVAMLDERTKALKQEIIGIADGVRRGANLDFGETVTYRSILGAWGSLRTARGLLGGALSLLRRRQTTNPPGPATANLPRRSLADRIGLVPPIARPLGRLFGHAMTARDVYRELKGRGLL